LISEKFVRIFLTGCGLSVLAAAIADFFTSLLEPQPIALAYV
jgi:hypothetical protein